MNIIIDRPQLVRAVLLYLTKSFGNLTPKEIKKYPDSLFYVNSENEVLMEYDKKTKVIWIDHDNIWSKLERYFYLEYNDIQLIMKDWLEETYKLGGVTPKAVRWFDYRWLEETYKLGGVTLDFND
jgi:hypothetical protein